MEGSNSEARLRAIVERVERLNAEKREIADQIKEVYAEAKGDGFMVMAIRQIVRERARNPDDVAEERAILDLYRATLGMQ